MGLALFPNADKAIMTNTDHLSLRPAGADDAEFLFEVYASTRAEELSVTPWSPEQKAEFLRMQFHAQHTFYHAQFPNAQYDVLERDGAPIGRLYVDRRADEIRVLDIALLPQHCGGGVGSRLIGEIMEEASAAGIPVSLHVETFNRAQHLYTRMGFAPVQNDGIYILMEWRAGGAADAHQNLDSLS